MPYYFRLPRFTDMTGAQMAVLDEPGPVSINGGPGTGKSVVSVWRHIRNHDIGTRKSVLLTYTKTLQTYLANCSSAEHAISGTYVHRTLKWTGIKVDEIIIDEAQDVPETQFPYFIGFAGSICYGADDQQILYPARSTSQAALQKLFPANKPHELDENFRNSYEILRFTKAIFPNKLISYNTLNQAKEKRETGIKPRSLVANGGNEKYWKAILDIIAEFRTENHNIGILLPLQDDVDRYFKFLVDSKIACTRYFHDGQEIAEIDNVHVTTFKSAKGIEFDTVILPEFGKWQSNLKSLYVVEENDYYVAFTRAKRNLFLLSSLPLTGIATDTYDTENL